MRHPRTRALPMALLFMAFFIVLGLASEASAVKLPAPATITVPGTDADGSYVIKWTKSATKTIGIAYKLQEATNIAFTLGKRTVPHTNALNASITGRTNGTTYYYRVGASKSGFTASTWTTGAKGCAVK